MNKKMMMTASVSAQTMISIDAAMPAIITPATTLRRQRSPEVARGQPAGHGHHREDDQHRGAGGGGEALVFDGGDEAEAEAGGDEVSRQERGAHHPESPRG